MLLGLEDCALILAEVLFTVPKQRIIYLYLFVSLDLHFCFTWFIHNSVDTIYTGTVFVDQLKAELTRCFMNKIFLIKITNLIIIKINFLLDTKTQNKIFKFLTR